MAYLILTLMKFQKHFKSKLYFIMDISYYKLKRKRKVVYF